MMYANTLSIAIGVNHHRMCSLICNPTYVCMCACLINPKPTALNPNPNV